LILSEDVTSKKSNRRGTDRREQHSVKLKAEVIHDKESGMTQDAIAEKYRINRSEADPGEGLRGLQPPL